MKPLLDPSHSLPLYHQLIHILKSKIAGGEWPVGSLIPTETELIRTYGVSRTTVREAVLSLANEGLLVKRRGKGTMVTSAKVEERLGNLTGFAEELLERGMRHSAKLISAQFKPSRFYELSKLELPDLALVFIVDRVRFAEGEPIAFERSCWPEAIGKLLAGEDLNKIAFYSVLEEKHGVVLKEASETIHAVNATSYEAELLGVSPGAALLERRRVSRDADGRSVEYTKTKYRSDRYAYKMQLDRTRLKG
ncbi:GntR family transcriptional regulator [Cohnella hongkongensis]|uniref:GntR family transcriptional regulator n=1 Tax=Cohnella hongkongensis TaxID=178337 RepID=A0ABV9F8M9_9BACL